MTDRPPVSDYENYPLAGDPDAERDPESASPILPASYPPAGGVQQSQPPRSGTSRRMVLGGIGVGVGAIVVASLIARGSTQPGFGTGEEPIDDEDEGDESERTVDLDGYEVQWPEGWNLDDYDGGSSATLTRGDNTVVFRSFSPSSDATAAEEAQRLLTRHTADLTSLGTVKTTRATTRRDETMAASARTTGRSDGDPVSVTSHVLIDDEEGQALAVIAVVLDSASDEVRAEVTEMRVRFLDLLS